MRFLFGCDVSDQRTRISGWDRFLNRLATSFSGSNSDSGDGGGAASMPTFTYRTPSMPNIPNYGAITDIDPYSAGGGSGGSSGMAMRDPAANSVSQTGNSSSQPGLWQYLSLGNGKPSLRYKKVFNNLNYDANHGLLGYQFIIRVYGDMYLDYNWIQTYYHNGVSGVDGLNYDGFFYGSRLSRDPMRIYGEQVYQGDADMFFEDSPNAYSFEAELTLVGLTERGWIPIQSFTWGYVFDINTGSFSTTRLRLINTPSRGHIEYLLWSLKLH